MASGVNIKMGVSGVQQFKQGMKDSQAAVKSLEAALKLNEAAMKNNANQEQYLENKTALLTRELEAQKNVVHQAEQALQSMQRNGVDKTSAAFQNMQTQLYKAQTDFVNIQNELEGVGDAGEDAQEGVSHMNQALQRIGTNVSFDAVVSGIDKVTNGLEAAAEKAIELGKKLVQAMLSGGQWADDLQETAYKWEMTPEKVYRMQQTANLIDTSAENIFNARQKLIKAMGQQDNKETMGAFAALGITNMTGSDENIENVFWNAGEAMMQMEDKVARNEYAMKLFGKSWTELIPIFKTGREEYEATMASWTWVGDQQFEALTQLDDESKKTQSAWENIQHTLEAAMAPAMTEILQSLQGMMSEFNKYLQSEEGQEMLAKLNEAVSSLFEKFTNLDPAEVIGKITEIFDKIKEGLEWFVQHKGEVFEALKYIAGGFALLKVTSLAANIGRIISGFTGLLGGKGTGGGSDVMTGGNGSDAVSTAATSGGFLPWVKNAMTAGASKVAASLTMFDPTGLTALIPEVLSDQTTFGRHLRNGGSLEEAATASWETIQASAKEGTNNFVKYFTEDIPKAFWGAMGITPEGLSEFLTNRNDNADAASRLSQGANWLPSYMTGISPNAGTQATDELLPHKVARGNVLEEAKAAESLDRMTKVAGEMGTAADNSTKASEDMTDAAKNLMTLPAELNTTVYNAIMAGMNAVTIVVDAGCVDTIGQRVGGAMGLGLIDLVR